MKAFLFFAIPAILTLEVFAQNSESHIELGEAHQIVSTLSKQEGAFKLYNCLVDLKISVNLQDCPNNTCGYRINVYSEDVFNGQQTVGSFLIPSVTLQESTPNTKRLRVLKLRRFYYLGNQRFYENLKIEFDNEEKISSVSMTKGTSSHSPVRGRVLCQRN